MITTVSSSFEPPETVSLVIAVTGHRDLDPEDDGLKENGKSRIQIEIENILKELRATYKRTPLRLLTGLAKGADQLAARAAWALKIPYVAVLPMPKELYLADFKNDSDFQQWLDRAERVLELPLESSKSKVEVPGPERDRQYESLGRFLVQSSQILIAVWDGQRIHQNGAQAGEKVAVGGTGHVVGMKLREIAVAGHASYTAMNTDGAGPVYVVPARRKGFKPGPQPALTREELYPDHFTKADYEKSYQLLNRFNTDIHERRKFLKKATRDSRDKLIEGKNASHLTDSMEWVAAIYAYADALAIYYAKISLRMWWGVFAFLVMGGVFRALWHESQGQLMLQWLSCGFYFLSAAGAASLMLREKKAERRGRHEDYRALAEALRVQFFWLAAGVRDNTTHLNAMVSTFYMLKQSGEMVWIRDAISECSLFEEMLTKTSPAAEERYLSFRLAHEWVSGQATYFLDTKQRHELRNRLWKIFGSTVAVVAVIAPLLDMVHGPALHGRGPVEGLERFFHLLEGIGAWCAALIWLYIERRGYAQEARQYTQMYEIFHRADENLKELETRDDESGIETIIRDLGREALTENSDWLMLHRERQLPVHVAAGP